MLSFVEGSPVKVWQNGQFVDGIVIVSWLQDKSIPFGMVDVDIDGEIFRKGQNHLDSTD